MGYKEPKLWIPGEPFSPGDFNTYLRDNLVYLSQRQSEGVFYKAGDLANIVTPTLPMVLDASENYTLTLDLDFTATLWFTGHLTVTKQSTASVRTWGIDILNATNNTYLSTGDVTAAGIVSTQMPTNACERTQYFSWFEVNWPPGVWVFKPYLIGGLSTETIDRAGASSSFRVLVI